jgi:hypothetical protein
MQFLSFQPRGEWDFVGSEGPCDPGPVSQRSDPSRPAHRAIDGPQDDTNSPARQWSGVRIGSNTLHLQKKQLIIETADGRCIGARPRKYFGRKHGTLARAEHIQAVRFPCPYHGCSAGLCGSGGLDRVQGVPTDALLEIRRSEGARDERGDHYQREERQGQHHSPVRRRHGRSPLRSATRVVSAKLSTDGRRTSRP